MKKLFTFLLALIAGAGTLFAANSGKCGDNLTWTIDTEHETLTISGTGEMYNWDKAGDVPWCKQRHYVDTLVIGEGVTRIGTHAFDTCFQIHKVYWNAKNCVSAPFDHYLRNPNIDYFIFGNEVEYIPAGLCQGMRGPRSITIPNSVKSIGGEAFEDCDWVRSVSIGSGVTYIGKDAFSGLLSLEKVYWNAKNGPYVNFTGNDVIFTFGNDVEVIPNNLCAYCIKITSMKIPNNVKIIGNKAFEGCRNLTDLKIGSGVTSIGDSAFINCDLKWISLPSGLKSIGSYAFSGNTRMTSAYIPNSVTSLGSGAFYQCPTLTSITIPDGVTAINAKTFQGCTSLANAYLPDNLTSIGDSAFKQCTSLADIDIPDNVTTMGKGVFNGCRFTSTIQNAHFFIYLPRMVTGNYAIKEGIETIVDRAFQGCESLTSVTIPSSVKEIRDAAFYGCNLLNSIICEAATPPACANEEAYSLGVWSLVDNFLPVYVPIGSVATYKNIKSGSAAAGWKHFENFLPLPYGSGKCSTKVTWTLKDSVLTISGTGHTVDWGSPKNVPWYEAREYIKSVVIEDGIVSIGKYAFTAYPNLVNVDIPGSLTIINETAFAGCPKLSRFKVSVLNADFAAPKGDLYNRKTMQLMVCPPAKETYTVGTYITSILPSAFDSCKAPLAVTCERETPATVSGNTLFAHVTGTIDVYVPEANIAAYKAAWGTTNCEYHALQNGECVVDGIKYSYHSDGTATVIANSPVYSGDIVIPETFTYGGKTYTVTQLGNIAFHNCSDLTSLSLPKTLVTIGNTSFGNCTKLTSIIIPENVSSLDEYTFLNSGLKTIYFKSYQAVPTVTGTPFGFIDANTLIYVPATLLSDYRTQWSGMTNIQPDLFFAGGLYYTIDPAKQNATVVQHPDGVGEYNPLVNVTIPEAIEAYGQTFSVDTIGKDAFYGCDELESITMPNSIVSIEEYAFYNCSAVKKFIIPGNVTFIGQRAFWDCKEMTSLAIYGNVATIGDYAFRNCSKIASITCEAATPPTCIYQCLNSVTKTIPLYVPSESVNAYKNATEWKDFTNIKQLIDKCKDVNNIEKAGEPIVLDSVYVIFVADRYAYVQDQSGTTLVYLTYADENIKPGVRISNIRGSVMNYRGLPEVKPNNQAEWILTPGGGETPIFVTVDDMPTADMVNQLVYIPKGAIEGVFVAGSQANLDLTMQNGKVIKLRSQFKQAETFTAAKVYDILVAVGKFNDEIQLYYIQIADTYNLYTIRFLNEDGSELQALSVPEGLTPVYTGETPVKAETDHSAFAFVGWDKPVAPAEENATYTAVFDEIYKEFTITVAVNDAAAGAAYGEGTYDYGTKVNLYAIPNADYHFVKWSDGVTDNPREVTVTADVTYTAVFEANSPSTALEQINQQSQIKNQKLMINGQLFILRDGKVYTVTGQRVE